MVVGGEGGDDVCFVVFECVVYEGWVVGCCFGEV